MYFLKKYKDRIIVGTVIVALLGVIGFTNAEREKISALERMTGNVFTPVSKVTMGIGKNVSQFLGSITDFIRTKEENDILKDKVSALESEIRDLENIIGMTDFLEKEAGIMKSTEYKLVSAEIAGKDPGNWYYNFIIDKGSKDGIRKGNTVIQGVELEEGVFKEGIVGRVMDVGDNWAKVITIIDEMNRISFKVTRTQDGGILSGSISIEGTVTGYLFDNKADIIVGDKLYTSGLGGSYIKDIYIGEVSGVFSDDEELTKRIEIQPAIDFKKMYKVFVVAE